MKRKKSERLVDALAVEKGESLNHNLKSRDARASKNYFVRSMTPTPSSPSHHWLIEKYLTVLTFQLPLHSYLSVALSPPIVLLSPLSQGTPQRCRPVLVPGHFTIQNLGNGLGFKNSVYNSGVDHLLISDHHFKPPGQRWSLPLISSLYHSWSARTSRWSLWTTRLLSSAI